MKRLTKAGLFVFGAVIRQASGQQLMIPETAPNGVEGVYCPKPISNGTETGWRCSQVGNDAIPYPKGVEPVPSTPVEVCNNQKAELNASWEQKLVVVEKDCENQEAALNASWQQQLDDLNASWTQKYDDLNATWTQEYYNLNLSFTNYQDESDERIWTDRAVGAAGMLFLVLVGGCCYLGCQKHKDNKRLIEVGRTVEDGKKAEREEVLDELVEARREGKRRSRRERDVEVGSGDSLREHLLSGSASRTSYTEPFAAGDPGVPASIRGSRGRHAGTRKKRVSPAEVERQAIAYLKELATTAETKESLRTLEKPSTSVRQLFVEAARNTTRKNQIIDHPQVQPLLNGLLAADERLGEEKLLKAIQNQASRSLAHIIREYSKMRSESASLAGEVAVLREEDSDSSGFAAPLPPPSSPPPPLEKKGLVAALKTTPMPSSSTLSGSSASATANSSAANTHLTNRGGRSGRLSNAARGAAGKRGRRVMPHSKGYATSSKRGEKKQPKARAPHRVSNSELTQPTFTSSAAPLNEASPFFAAMGRKHGRQPTLSRRQFRTYKRRWESEQQTSKSDEANGNVGVAGRGQVSSQAQNPQAESVVTTSPGSTAASSPHSSAGTLASLFSTSFFSGTRPAATSRAYTKSSGIGVGSIPGSTGSAVLSDSSDSAEGPPPEVHSEDKTQQETQQGTEQAAALSIPGSPT